jgi:hypothetical protein
MITPRRGNMLFKILGCYMVVVQMAAPYKVPEQRLQESVNTCVEIIDEAHRQDAEYLSGVYLALAWQESRFTMDAKGKWLCTGGGTVKESSRGRRSCTKGKLTRAMGPMQILPIYHCKGETDCNYLAKSVKLLADLTAQHGLRRGLKIYAGGFGPNPRAERYAKMTLWRSSKVDEILDFVWDLRFIV